MKTIEAKAYASRLSSGLLEVFVGVGLVLLGLGWLADLVAVTAVVPILLISLWSPVVRRVVVPRSGSARFAEGRRRRERRGLWTFLGVGVIVLAVALGIFVVGGRGLGLGEVVAGLPLAILAVAAGLGSVVFGLGRLGWFALALAAAGVATVLLGWDPGLGFIAAGVAFLVVGCVLLARYVAGHPPVGDGAA
jgi:hypothetical protein